MNNYSDFEPTYTPRRKDNGRWCVVLIRADGSEREIGDFASDSEAWDWINTNAGKQISAAASEAAVVGGRVMSQWFVPPIVIPAAFVAFIVALALYRLFVGA
jgi:hypothetical protein